MSEHGGARARASGLETRRTTLADVASLAGVSVTTASYILNGRAVEMRISEDASARVLEAARALSYRPNRTARSLRTARSATIGVITDYVAGGRFATEMLSGANLAAQEARRVLLIGETEGSPRAEEALVDEMVGRGVDGILYATVTISEIQVPPALRAARAVLLNCVDPRTEVPAVLPDEREGGRTAASLLLEAGHRDGIYVVGEPPDEYVESGLGRVPGLVEGLAEQAVEVAGWVACQWGVVHAHAAVRELLRGGHRPAAIVCLNDRIAMGVYQALAEVGLSALRDLSVLSFDGSELATWLDPPVTSVAIPYAAMGAAAVEMLLHGERGVRRLPMPVQEGVSVRTAARADRRV